MVAAGACPGAPGTTETSGSDSESGCELGTLDCQCRPDQTCDSGLLCASNTCIENPQATTTGPVTTTSSATMGSTSEGTTETTSGGPTTTSDTSVEPECDPAMGTANNPACAGVAGLPYCSADGECVSCSEISCAQATPLTPVCDAESGRCEQCTADDASACAGSTPICDAAAMKCVPCVEHGQCASGVCHLEAGSCFPPKELWVNKAAIGCAGGDGSMASPFCEIDDAVKKVGLSDPTIIRVLPAASPYTAPVVVQESRVLAIFRHGDGKTPVRLDVINASALSVGAGSAVYVDGLAIGGSVNIRGVSCNDAALWLDRSEVEGRKEVGIDGNACDLRLRRSQIAANTIGGIRLKGGGSLRLENSFVVNNGNFGSLFGGVSLEGGVSASIAYASIIANNVQAGGAASLACGAGDKVEVRNSIVIAEPGKTSVTCEPAAVHYSAIDAPKYVGMGTTNTKIDTLNAGWFKDIGSYDYHLAPVTPFKDVALWEAGHPTVDFDGNPRPKGTMLNQDYAGADVP